MKTVSQWALLSAALVLGIAYACATPEEITVCQSGRNLADCDVILSEASDFDPPDASVQALQGGSDGVSPPSGGSAGTTVAPPSGGAAGTSSPASGGSAGQGAAGSGQSAGAGGASGGAAGSGAGTGGVAGTGGSAGSAGTTGASGAGGTTAQSNFSPASCDFDNTTGCQNLGCTCAQEQCGARCTNIVQCLRDNIDCITEADPLCAIRNAGAPNTCTAQVDTGGGATTTDANQPATIVRALVNCVCSDPRP
ncbi:MAG: hypothetical protein ABI895_13975 [Deltaproteobacteria bacterium]